MNDTRKVVINTCYGGFSLSQAAAEAIYARWQAQGKTVTDMWGEPLTPATSCDKWSRDAQMRDIPRDDPDFVAVVEELGAAQASGRYASLRVVEIPADVEWEIEEYDGAEHVAEAHRTWS